MIKYETVLSEHSLHYQKNFCKYADLAFGHRRDKPTRHLEVGVYEGGSAIWMLDNILTHRDSIYVGIDDNPRLVARNNLRKYGEKHIFWWGDSLKLLPIMVKDQYVFETAYIDGCHLVPYVLSDIENTLAMMRSGGVILVDDYDHSEYQMKDSIDKFCEERSNNIEVVYRDYTIILRKK